MEHRHRIPRAVERSPAVAAEIERRPRRVMIRRMARGGRAQGHSRHDGSVRGGRDGEVVSFARRDEGGRAVF